MEKKLFIKQLLASVFVGFFLGCGGSSPSISIQPSQNVFEQEAVEKVSSMDILWVIDNSGSMRAYQKKVEDEIVTFMNNFTQKEFNDFQIGFIGTAAWQDLNFDNYSSWNDTSTGFLEEDKPGIYDYSASPTGRLKTTTWSSLEEVICTFCENRSGRPVSIFNNDLLNELKTYCSGASAPCASVGDVNGDTFVDGNDAFINLIKETITSLGTTETGDERPLQSIQAARLNPNNADFFRENTHLATIIVSDEEDSSRPNDVTDYRDNCSTNANDSTGEFSCDNNMPSSYFKEFLDVTSNPVLGAKTHALVINSVSTHPDNAIPSENQFSEGSWGFFRRDPNYFNPANTLECRTANIEGGENGFQRFFAVRTTELAELTGGVVASLCGDYSVSLNNIAQKILEATVEFALGDNEPSEQDLNNNLVFVAIKNPGETEFTTIPRDIDKINGWDYNAVNNSIVFFGEAIPDNGAQISVVFDRDTF